MSMGTYVHGYTIVQLYTWCNTHYGPLLACFPGKMEFPCWCSKGGLRREDSGAEMYGGGKEGGRHRAEDIGDPIWCAEDCVYAV